MIFILNHCIKKLLHLYWLMPTCTTDSYGSLSIKIAGNNIPASLATYENTWKKFLPEILINILSLMKILQSCMKPNNGRKHLIIFACLAIFIACLGLFGLSAFAIMQRLKEIGIRKVLGANINNCCLAVKRFFKTGCFCSDYCLSCCLVFHE